jgi:hypothetical protein
MSSLRGVGIAVLGGAIGTFAVAALVVGCGGDDVTPPPTDAGAEDQTAEAAPDVGSDTGRDSLADARDALADAEAAADADARGDAADGSTPDADGAIEAARDAADAADARPDSSDAADAADASDASDALDTGSDAPNAIQEYATQYAKALCVGEGKCCPGYDAGAFDMAHCSSVWTTVGWEYTLPASSTAYTAGHLVFNADAGAGCLAALQNFDCTTLGTVTAAQYSAVTTACLGVLKGTLAPGAAGCISSFECANGYCSLPTDGGTGTCTALAANGGTCAPGVDSPDQMCSQAGAYQPPLWCNRLAGGATGTCAAPLVNGATCYDPTVSASYYDDYGCTSLLCGDDALCGDPATYPTPPPGFCENFATDAGGVSP